MKMKNKVFKFSSSCGVWNEGRTRFPAEVHESYGQVFRDKYEHKWLPKLQ